MVENVINIEKTYRLIVEKTPDAIILISDLKIIFANNSAAKLFSFEPEHFPGLTFTDFLHHENKNELESLLFNFKKRRTFSEEKFINGEGNTLIIECAFCPIKINEDNLILFTGRDATKRRRIEEELRFSEEQFKAVVQNINGYIYSVHYQDDIPVYSYHSPQCLMITGYSPEEYIRDPELWIKMVHDDDRERVYELFNDITENLQQTHIEHRIVHKSGEVRWISNIFTVSLNEDGDLIHLYGFILNITDRKKAEDALQEQYQFLQKLIDTIPNPIYYKDKIGIFLGCNIAFEKYIGKSRSEIIGKTTDELMDEEEATIHSRMDRLLFENPGIQVYEIKSRFADSSLRDTIVNKAIYKNKDNSIGGLVGVISDINTFKKIQNELASALERLREMESIVNKSPAIVFLWRAEDEWPVEFVSQNIRQFGYTAEEFISGKIKYGNIIFPPDAARISAEVEFYSREKYAEFMQEYRILNKNNEVCWVSDHTWVRRDINDRVTHFQGIVIDITNKKTAELQIKESEARYRTLAENSYDLICELSSKSRFLYVSPNSIELLGFTPEELEEQNILDYIHLDDIPGVLTELKKEYGRVILRFKHKTEGWKWFESAGRKFKTASGELRGVIVSRDISDRKRLEQQLIQTEKLMAVGEMSAMIAHEFRNALTSVKMILQLTGESENLSASEKKSFGIAINSIYHMETVVQQLLNFALPTPHEFKQEDINSVLKECLPFIKMQSKKRNILVFRKFDKSIPPLRVNGPSIREAVINLLLNSTQAFENSDTLTRRVSLISKKTRLTETLRDFSYSLYNENLGIRSKSSDTHEIILEKDTECVLIEVSDNGCGIENGYLSRIFEPFFTTKEKGSGLGLAIVKRTINSHGGVVKVESTPNSGTTFKIYLPIYT